MEPIREGIILQLATLTHDQEVSTASGNADASISHRLFPIRSGTHITAESEGLQHEDCRYLPACGGVTQLSGNDAV